jgi:16S rRNA (guanine966-N2)-methyltransferase
VPRIIAGTARGRRLQAPAGDATRPTADRAREALFSALESLVLPWGARSFLDLYAGSGAVGLEAASRGAREVVLVERDPKALKVLRSNVDLLDMPGVRVEASPVERFAAASSGRTRFDVVFADPPYDLASNELGQVLTDLLASHGLADDAVVVVERRTRDASWVWPEGFTGLRERAYGEATLWYGRAAANG